MPMNPNQKILTLRSLTSGVRPVGRTYGELYVNLADNQLGVIDNSNTARDLIGIPVFSTLRSYTAGQIVAYQGQLYAALVAVAAGAWNAAQWTPFIPQNRILPGYLFGCELAYVDASRIQVSAGAGASDDSVPSLITLPATIIKNLTQPWVPGNNVGGWDGTNVNVPPTGFVYGFLIQRTDYTATDVLFSSLKNPIMPSGYTRKRYIGAVWRYLSSNVMWFQKGDYFYISVQQWASITTQVAWQLMSTGCPPGVFPLFNLMMNVGLTPSDAYVQLSVTPSIASPMHVATNIAGDRNVVDLIGPITDVNGQTFVQVILNAGSINACVLSTYGWIDPRGRVS